MAMQFQAVLAVLLDGTPRIVTWGWFQITVANFVVIVLMLAVFIAAVLVPFRPGDK